MQAMEVRGKTWAMEVRAMEVQPMQATEVQAIEVQATEVQGCGHMQWEQRDGSENKVILKGGCPPLRPPWRLQL